MTSVPSVAKQFRNSQFPLAKFCETNPQTREMLCRIPPPRGGRGNVPPSGWPRNTPSEEEAPRLGHPAQKGWAQAFPRPILLPLAPAGLFDFPDTIAAVRESEIGADAEGFPSKRPQ